MRDCALWVLQVCLRFTQILLPLLFTVGLCFCLERAFFFRRSRLRPESLLVGLKKFATDGRYGEALQLCEQTPGPLARVLKRFLLSREENPDGEEEEKWRRQAEWELRALECHMGTIALLAKLLPQVGCLGTLLALLDLLPSGQQIFGVPDLLSALLPALAATAGAIALNLGYHFLYGRLDGRVREIFSGAEEFTEFCGARRCAFSGDQR
ncbi:MAG: MotA/TolQ/ExbB proton channel family protein [Puniceicoccales bacterium]|jgi:biopolymer transport protein ExbB|nr:MotA/TolQ/ExbB proton channel family protein [Puniceicoccales bacterium]